ncbi:MAG: DUF445 family protein [Bdellovibrionales bacterium]|nr:DUF445 family protein [Bdellovibrionales bacterium]
MEDLFQDLLSSQFVQPEYLSLWALPLIGALIGWVTNYIAVKMLFHPRRPLRLLFFSVQGVFPKRQKALAHKLGKIVSDELISVGDITEKLKGKATSEEVLHTVADRIEKVLTDRLPVIIPMVAMFLTPDLIQMIKNAFMDDLRSMIGDVIEKLSHELESELDVHEMVEEKVANFSSDKLEEILFAIMSKEFRFIELVGAVLGFLIGLVQVGWLLSSGTVS